jgi:hypothetical protein
VLTSVSFYGSEGQPKGIKGVMDWSCLKDDLADAYWIRLSWLEWNVSQHRGADFLQS